MFLSAADLRLNGLGQDTPAPVSVTDAPSGSTPAPISITDASSGDTPAPIILPGFDLPAAKSNLPYIIGGVAAVGVLGILLFKKMRRGRAVAAPAAAPAAANRISRRSWRRRR